MDCGHDPDEIQHALARQHVYAEVALFGNLTLVLCGFCQVDFSSHDATYCGLPKGTRVDLETMRVIKPIIEVHIGKDKYCPNCGHRLTFLRFLKEVRELNARRASQNGA
jgi:hypothetical protein